jgi:Ca-activated chloride channel family protein
VTFEWPLALIGLVLVPLAAAAYARVERGRGRDALRFTNVDLLASILPLHPLPRRRFVPPGLFLLALVLALVALARPRVAHTVHRKQATIVLVIDTSGSMVASDVRPTRLAAAQEAVRRFIDRLPSHFQVGVVTFASEPRVSVPVTDDHTLALQGIEHLSAFGGTALGDAISRAVRLLRPRVAGKRSSAGVVTTPPARPGTTPPAAIVLLSDGAQNRGRLPALEGAELARKNRIPVHTVALGTAQGTLRISDGASSERVAVPPDPRTLRAIANRTRGQFYAAASGARLKEVYERLATRLSVRRTRREATFAFLAGSSILLVAAGLLSGLWLPRLP